jgi:hypothetical protein
VNPGIAPQVETPPDLVVTRISGEPVYALRRATATTSSRISIECRSRSFTEMDKLGQAVIKALQDLRGTFAGRRAQFQAAGSDVENHADDASMFVRVIDFYVWDSPV